MMPPIQRTRSIIPLIATLLIVSLATTSHAGWWSNTLRTMGLGWSDGYHSRNGCPTCQGPCQCDDHSQIPHSYYETLPTPARSPQGAFQTGPSPRTATRGGKLPSQNASPWESVR